MDAAITVPAKILGQRDDVSRQTLLVSIILRTMALRRTMLDQNTAGPPLRYRENATDLLDRFTATGGIQKVTFDASWRIALSSARSATSFFSCAFSRSRSLALRPPTAPSDVPDQPSGRHIPYAIDTASAPRSRSADRLKLPSLHARQAHLLHAASQ